MVKQKNPEVAVVVTNYNYGQYLEQAIKSVLSQSYGNIKLFIIDDASTDDSRKILKKYSDRSTLIKHSVNQGIVFSRNEALDLVKSPFVLFLDADDWLNNDYVDRLVSAAQDDGLDVAYCGMQYYVDGEKGMDWIPPQFDIERLKNENYIHSASLLRTESISNIRFDAGMEKLTHEDWDFFLNLALKGRKFKRVDKASLNYRFKSSGRNITNADEKFASLYKYLYEKYNTERPQEIGYLAYYRFVKSFLSASEKLATTQTSLSEAQQKASDLGQSLDAILNSRAYIIGRLILSPINIARRLCRKLYKVHPVAWMEKTVKQSRLANTVTSRLFNIRNNQSKYEKYFISRYGKFNKKSDFAVILHLYLTDNMDIDLYITMPESNREYIKIIHKSFKSANIFLVPNRGRDVLPFIKAASVLSEMGYKKVLKVHTKKSTHRDIEGNSAESGDNWLKNTVNSLIPDDTLKLQALARLLSDQETGMIGTREYLYPLKMYLKNNRHWIEIIMGGFDKNFFSGKVSTKLEKIYYFGGTMFWVDLKAIHEVLNISKRNFQREQGQTDSTVAHGLERVFCILPQLKNKKIYSITSDGITQPVIDKPSYPNWYYDDISGGKPQISIVVPVYSDWWSLSKNINSLKKYIGNSEDVSVHYVNDCGPEVDIIEKKIMKNISGLTNFYYHRNQQNLGFVKTCNRASFELVNKADDILLLNSDTKVTKNFVFEMRKVLYSSNNIGAVTSRSNNATIWSVPMTSRLANYRLASYLLYRFIKNRLPYMYITPTIHGFCALIRREVIDKYGLFDEVYGKGYGEENDFAMRITAQGWLCAVANQSFVFHYESRSFGNEVRNMQIEKNEKILLERYPNYRTLVQEYWNNIKEPLK
jgi:GT2 family glycosyltransferase